MFLHRCTINTVSAAQLQGDLHFTDCRLRPEIRQEAESFYILESTLGTRFTNCTLEAPVVNGTTRPELVNRLGFVEINRSLRHAHLNTGLGREVVEYYRAQGIRIAPEFVAMLRARHEFEE